MYVLDLAGKTQAVSFFFPTAASSCSNAINICQVGLGRASTVCQRRILITNPEKLDTKHCKEHGQMMPCKLPFQRDLCIRELSCPVFSHNSSWDVFSSAAFSPYTSDIQRQPNHKQTSHTAGEKLRHRMSTPHGKNLSHRIIKLDKSRVSCGTSGDLLSSFCGSLF